MNAVVLAGFRPAATSMPDTRKRETPFAFIGNIIDVSMIFEEKRPQEAVDTVLDILPPGHYSTDLGSCLNTFCNEHLDAIDRRTTLIFVGDGRNNTGEALLEVMDALNYCAAELLRLAREKGEAT